GLLRPDGDHNPAPAEAFGVVTRLFLSHPGVREGADDSAGGGADPGARESRTQGAGGYHRPDPGKGERPEPDPQAAQTAHDSPGAGAYQHTAVGRFARSRCGRSAPVTCTRRVIGDQTDIFAGKAALDQGADSAFRLGKTVEIPDDCLCHY